MPRIFISYRREDSSGYAGRLFDRLEDRFGKTNIFMDIDSLSPGVDFVEVINSNVGASDVLLAIIGKNWLSAKDEGGQTRLENPEDFVRLEISAALKRGVRVIPLLVGGAQMPRSQELPQELAGLARRQAFIVHDDAFRPRVDWLIRNIEETESARKAEQERQPREADRSSGTLEEQRRDRLKGEKQAFVNASGKRDYQGEGQPGDNQAYSEGKSVGTEDGLHALGKKDNSVAPMEPDRTSNNTVLQMMLFGLLVAGIVAIALFVRFS